MFKMVLLRLSSAKKQFFFFNLFKNPKKLCMQRSPPNEQFSNLSTEQTEKKRKARSENDLKQYQGTVDC